MCDAGRYSYKRIESEERLLRPTIRTQSGRDETDWPAALARVDEQVSHQVGQHGIASAAAIITADLSNEELWAARQLLVSGMRIEQIAHRCPPDPNGVEDDLLRKADTFPNSFGTEMILGDLDRSSAEVETILKAAAGGQIRVLFVLGDGLAERFDGETLRSAFSQVAFVVAFQTHRTIVTELATVALPLATYAEKDSTVCNFEGHVQRTWPAIAPVGESRPLIEVLADLARRWEVQGAPNDPELCFEALAAGVPYFASLTYDTLGESGMNPARQGSGAAAKTA
jgi:predicted molibdopterin-dependent oxidoreductase YjgC